MEKMEKFEEVKEVIDNMSEWEKVDLWNEYCGAVSYYDDEIYCMESFDDLFRGCSPLEIAEKVYGEDFRYNDDYFKIGIYGIESADYVDELGADFDDVAEYIVDTETHLYNSDIEDLIDSWNDEEEEEEEEEK